MEVAYVERELGEVAPRKGRVSRNNLTVGYIHPESVAPRKGRVSRNDGEEKTAITMKVAPRKGRVSRNLHQSLCETPDISSRPARGV